MNTYRFAGLFTFLLFLLCVPSKVPAQAAGWGNNSGGNLANGTFANKSLPIAVPNSIGISSSFEHTLFLKPDGTVAASGYNLYGQLGRGTNENNYYATALTIPNLNNVIQVCTGDGNSTALKSDGTVWSWGKNSGLVGNGTTDLLVTSPTQGSIANVVQISTGASHKLALKGDGTVWAWGSNGNGQLGDGFMTSRSSPVQVGTGVSGFDSIIAVSAGEFHSMALKSDGTVWIWGNNDTAQIGNGAAGGNQLVPVMNSTLTGVIQISAGAGHNLALKATGRVSIWGDNRKGQGTTADPPNQLTPFETNRMSGVVDIRAGGYHNLARLRSGGIIAWGSNDFGQLGNGTFSVTGCRCISVPADVPGSGNALIQTGVYNSFAIKPSFSTSTGTNVRHSTEQVSLTFASVAAAGTTSYTAIDPTATGLTVPAGYTIQDFVQSFNITSTATPASGSNIDVCLTMPGGYSPTQFTFLKILHGEGGALVDRTVSTNYLRRQVCARVASLSPFVVAQGFSPTAASVSIGGRVMTDDGRGLTNASVYLTGQNGETFMARTSAFGYYRFDDIRAGQTVIVTVVSKRYQFASRVISVTEEIKELNFLAEP